MSGVHINEVDLLLIYGIDLLLIYGIDFDGSRW